MNNRTPIGPVTLKFQVKTQTIGPELILDNKPIDLTELYLHQRVHFS